MPQNSPMHSCAGGEIVARRALFPAGLTQPAGSFRFGADALLLAAFASMFLNEYSGATEPVNVCELGCGCGAALLALSLRREAAYGFGLDIEPALVAAARENAVNLGVSHRTRWAVADVRDISAFSGFRRIQGTFRLVMANPPWLEQRRGKSSLSVLRERAIVGGNGILEAFGACAAGLLEPGGLLCMILATGSIALFRDMCSRMGLGFVSTMPILSFSGQPAKRTLTVASSAAFALDEKPLVLHSGTGANTDWTREALKFCPWLRKRGKRREDVAQADNSGVDQSFSCTAKTLR